MNATLDIDPEVLRAAEEKARQTGRTVDQIAEEALRREIGEPHPVEGTPNGPPPLPPEFFEKIRLLAYPEFTPPEWEEILRQRAEWFEKHGNSPQSAAVSTDQP